MTSLLLITNPCAWFRLPREAVQCCTCGWHGASRSRDGVLRIRHLRNCRVSQGPCLPSWLNLTLRHVRLFSLLPSQRYSPLCRTTEHTAMKGQGADPSPPVVMKPGVLGNPRLSLRAHEGDLVHPSPGVPSGQQMQGCPEAPRGEVSGPTSH